MRALGVDPLRKLVTPRIAATICMLLFLTIVSDACGIAGGGQLLTSRTLKVPAPISTGITRSRTKT